MRKLNSRFFILITLVLIVSSAFSQSRNNIKNLIELKSEEIPALNKEIDISVSDVKIQEFLRGVANLSGININIDPGIDIKISNNFNQVKVSDIIIYLCEYHKLDLHFTGNIITITEQVQEVIKEKGHEKVIYDSNSNKLTLDFAQENIIQVIKEITLKSDKNVIITPGIENHKISGYVQLLPFDVALDKLFYSNSLLVKKDNNGVYVISKKEDEVDDKKNSKDKLRGKSTAEDIIPEGLTLEVSEKQTISIIANDVELLDIIKSVSQLLNKNIAILSDIQGKLYFNASDINYNEFINIILKNTPYNTKVIDGIYIFGEYKSPEFQHVELFQFHNRTTDKIIDQIPADLKMDVELKEYPELNSMLISGSSSRAHILKDFLYEIDKPVPVVLIELIIVDVNKTYSVSTGIQAGIGTPPKSNNTVFPGYDLNLSTKAINDLITGFNDFGLLKLGKVTPDFYLNIKALEDQGVLDIHSTPKLSTLNGHEAVLSIGRTEYYLEEQNNYQGTLSTQVINTKTYKSVNASLDLTIRPMISGNEQITLDIDMSQSDFTERLSDFAPPGAVNRSFKSTVRVKNQEVILLGGLEEKRTSDTSTGFPFLSRIPVIKWFFSNKNKQDSKSKLSIFLKPIIIN